MTFRESTPVQPEQTERHINFAFGGVKFYQLHQEVEKLNIVDHLGARLAQLSAMLTMIHGAGFETFENWSDEIKQDYLWACSMLASECKELANHV